MDIDIAISIQGVEVDDLEEAQELADACRETMLSSMRATLAGRGLSPDLTPTVRSAVLR